MFEYFYNEILRRTIISFGTLFNNVSIKKTDSSDNVVSVVKVPLAYGPTEKFLARINQSPDLNKPTQITLPRMSFEFTGLTYDPSRKVTTTQQFVVKDPDDGTETKKSYMPVPYNMQFELSIMTKLNDDALQIVEQILPYFQPAYNLSIELVESIKEKRDVPIVLENITMQDDYEGDFTSRRVLLYTLRFTAKNIFLVPHLLHPRISSRRQESVYLLEQIHQILQEKLHILLLQEQSKTTRETLLPHCLLISQQRQKHLKLMMQVVLQQKHMWTWMERNSSSRLSMATKLQSTEVKTEQLLRLTSEVLLSNLSLLQTMHLLKKEMTLDLVE